MSTLVDLEGLDVQTVEGVKLGIASHLFSTGSNDVLVTRGDRERMIPFVMANWPNCGFRGQPDRGRLGSGGLKPVRVDVISLFLNFSLNRPRWAWSVVHRSGPAELHG